MKRIMKKLLTPAMAALCLLMASMPLRAFDEVSPQSGVITFADADGAALSASKAIVPDKMIIKGKG